MNVFVIMSSGGKVVAVCGSLESAKRTLGELVEDALIQGAPQHESFFSIAPNGNGAGFVPTGFEVKS